MPPPPPLFMTAGALPHSVGQWGDVSGTQLENHSTTQNPTCTAGAGNGAFGRRVMGAAVCVLTT